MLAVFMLIHTLLASTILLGTDAMAAQVWSGRMWPLYLLLLPAVELHLGIGLYRLAMKWGWFEADRSAIVRRRLKAAMWGVIVVYVGLGLASLATDAHLGIALDAGVAPLADMEAVQFHPTGIFPAGILVTEGCRGDGRLLRDVHGARFMPDYEPVKKELASRDVVARRMEQHIRAGHGAQSRFGEHLWLDITLLGRRHIEHDLREVHDICRYFLGIDPAKQWIPVRPAQHYTMGGIRTQPTGESTGLRGLFAAGDAACWDLHGFNRLGGNTVAETVVAGMLVGE